MFPSKACKLFRGQKFLKAESSRQRLALGGVTTDGKIGGEAHSVSKAEPRHILSSESPTSSTDVQTEP